MKTLYKRLNKKEKKKAIEDFKNYSPQYREAIKKLKNMKFLSGFGMVYGIFSFIFDLLMENKVIHLLIDASLFIFCFFIFIKANDLIVSQVNTFLVQNKKLKK